MRLPDYKPQPEPMSVLTFLGYVLLLVFLGIEAVVVWVGLFG